jgi:glutathione reductase (NADPH)
MYGAQFADAFADAIGYGWSVADTARNELSKLTVAKNAQTARLQLLYRELLAASNVSLVAGRAQILDAHTVTVDGQVLTAERVLIAAGSATQWPEIPGISLAISSDAILDLKVRPQRLVILGAGYIGVEFAGIFQGLGSDVVIAYRSDAPLRGFDRDVRTRLATAMQARGVGQLSNFQISKIERHGSLLICRGADGRSVVADAVLNAMGRSPNTAGLFADGFKPELINTDGAIQVDAYSRTSVPSIFAVGDVTNRLNLTPIAIAEARAFVDSEFSGTPRAIQRDLVASAVFSQPPLAQIGLSEQALMERNGRALIFEAEFRPMKNLLAARDERSYMKLIVDAFSDRVLGLHMLGPDAPEIVQSLAVAVTIGARKKDFDATLAVHPTAAEEFVLMRAPTREIGVGQVAIA